MTSTSRIPAALAYIPILGWLYVLVLARRDGLALYHVRQSIGLACFLAAVTLGWLVLGWLLTALIPLAVVLAVALFALVMAAYFFGAIAWLVGISNALRARSVPLPLFGEWAGRLRIA